MDFMQTTVNTVHRPFGLPAEATQGKRPLATILNAEGRGKSNTSSFVKAKHPSPLVEHGTPNRVEF